MSERFFDRPILNSPYEYPARHWELDEGGHGDGAQSRDIVPNRYDGQGHKGDRDG